MEEAHSGFRGSTWMPLALSAASLLGAAEANPAPHPPPPPSRNSGTVLLSVPLNHPRPFSAPGRGGVWLVSPSLFAVVNRRAAADGGGGVCRDSGVARSSLRHPLPRWHCASGERGKERQDVERLGGGGGCGAGGVRGDVATAATIIKMEAG